MVTNREITIGLIIPPSIFLADERVFPSLGILKVAAALERAGYRVMVIDLNGVGNYQDVLRQILQKHSFFLIGITATSPQMVPVNSICCVIREESPDTPVVLGGPHITAAFASQRIDQKGSGSGRGTKEVRRLQDIADILIAGDGELAILKICQMLQSTPRPSFPFFIDGDNLDSDLFLSEEILNELPFPARHLIDLGSYHYSIEGKPSTSLISELGCLAAGTKITLADGQEIPIENITTGDRVICWDEYGGQLSTGTVVNNWGRDADDLWRLRLVNGTVLLVTSEHPLWTENGWKKVDDLKPEDHIAVVQDILQFTAIKSREWIGKARVYNMTVCPGHSYIANGIVVHNCSYGCYFCGMRNSPSFRKIRARSPENVKEELIHLHRTYGYVAFMFSDDELNIPSSFPMLMRRIIEAQEEVGQEFRLRCFAKSNLFTEHQAGLMYEAGFRHILIGFESGSDRILTNINKRATKAQNTKCMEIAYKYGLKIKALMSIGHPGESEETIRETEQWLLDVKPHDFDATTITVYFGTPYSDQSKPHETIPGVWTFTSPKTGDRIHFHEIDFMKDSSYYKGIPGEYKSYTFSDYLSCEELVSLRDTLENNVREKLSIPFYGISQASRIETSMGQGFPLSILRSSKELS